MNGTSAVNFPCKYSTSWYLMCNSLVWPSSCKTSTTYSVLFHPVSVRTTWASISTVRAATKASLQFSYTYLLTCLWSFLSFSIENDHEWPKWSKRRPIPLQHREHGKCARDVSAANSTRSNTAAWSGHATLVGLSSHPLETPASRWKPSRFRVKPSPKGSKIKWSGNE